MKTTNSSTTNIITQIHSKVHSITTLVVTKVHMVLWSYIVLTWMCDNRELVQHMTLWNNTKCNIVMLELTLTIGQVRCLKV